ncbi:hypothetical protein [Thalassovita taeanensis]|uniref:ATP synthase subunit b n=1 Tax=Thalassovita taeanensis TaxID=657014 RepID=A0A1H9HBU8_9RHOB|nr:hypothetical protein [Thalassovita taeanensis]SEQ59737.1 ATP synthase F0 subcomplex B subunit [Thalassovita taeanensis]
MQFDWWTFGFQVINVTVLMWLLSHFMFRPVARIIAERQAETNRILAAAEAAQQQAAEAEATAMAGQRKNAAERLQIIDAARSEAETQKKKILDQAEKAAADIAAKAYDDAARRAEEDRNAQLDKAAELAVSITQKLLGNLPQDARISGYPERLKEALISLDAEQREALGTGPDPLRLVAPRILTKAEMAAATEAIREVVATDQMPAFTLDESLIAGLELSGRHGVIHNSLKYDLGRIAEALAKNGKI